MDFMVEDAASQELIARLLEEERAYSAAEALQLRYILADSKSPIDVASGSSKPTGYETPPSYSIHENDDLELALRLSAQEAFTAADSSIASTLQTTEAARAQEDREHALRLAAADRRDALDWEYAKRLQTIDDEGQNDVDDENMKDIESVIGGDDIQMLNDSFTAKDLNFKGKAKDKRLDLAMNDSKGKSRKHHPNSIDFDWNSSTPTSTYPICGICLEPFILSITPARLASQPTSSSRLSYGLQLPCPKTHPYCLDCLRGYLESKLEEGERGNLVFPMRCPECPVESWYFEDGIAERVLNQEGFVRWHHQKLLDTIPRFYCPNKRCSTRLDIGADESAVSDPQGSCPSCDELLCVPCRAAWHEGLSCEEYQSLPASERNPDDQLVLQLAKAQSWRRCPNCQVIVELTQGCNHITCPCGKHFCFKCGSDWDKEAVKCTRKPACELWDEEMLLAQGERERERQALAHPLPPPPPPPPPPRAHQYEAEYEMLYGGGAPEYRPAPRRYGVRDLDWLINEGVNMRHPFTRETVMNLTCQYCNVRLRSLRDLTYHLEHVRRHAVWACCGRLFKRDSDWQKHRDANLSHHDIVDG